ncbi:MAG: prephenate dehydratase [Lachnospiraceae bacterium]|nr:prephenate dehydratase [Lachnospiraceae bacterium]
MKDLMEIRKEIDEIDRELYDLFDRRLRLAGEVAAYKMAHDLPVFDAIREKEKLNGIADRSKDPFFSHGMVELFSQIMSISRKKQYRILAKAGKLSPFDFSCVKELPYQDAGVVYQGVEGAYGQMAAETFFGGDKGASHVPTWRDAMEELKDRRADYAVLPIENSTAGSVVENYDLLAEYDVTIVGEQILEIDHALLGLPGTNIADLQRIYSHPQAISQCSGYLRAHPQIKAVGMDNTAVSARKIKQDGDVTQAAIAAEINAGLYGLCVLEKAIQDESCNRTRFIIVSNRHIYRENATKVSICFELPHETGSLYQSLSHIIFNGLNMTRIESRPIRSKPWQYRFFVDFQGNLKDEDTQNALRGMSEETLKLRILGNY